MHIKKTIFYGIGSLCSKTGKNNTKGSDILLKKGKDVFLCKSQNKKKKLNEINFLKSYFVTALKRSYSFVNFRINLGVHFFGIQLT